MHGGRSPTPLSSPSPSRGWALRMSAGLLYSTTCVFFPLSGLLHLHRGKRACRCAVTHTRSQCPSIEFVFFCVRLLQSSGPNNVKLRRCTPHVSWHNVPKCVARRFIAATPLCPPVPPLLFFSVRLCVHHVGTRKRRDVFCASNAEGPFAATAMIAAEGTACAVSLSTF